MLPDPGGDRFGVPAAGDALLYQSLDVSGRSGVPRDELDMRLICGGHFEYIHGK